MDFLLASYGSDEEGDDSLPGSPMRSTVNSSTPAVSASLHTLFSALPPPKNSVPDKSDGNESLRPLKRKADEGKPEKRTSGSLFVSLPPPKNSAEGSFDFGEVLANTGRAPRNGIYGPTNVEKEEKKPGSSLFASLPPPKLNSAAMPLEMFRSSTSVSPSQVRTSGREIPARHSEAASLIAQLPSSVSSKSLFDNLPTPSNSKLVVDKVQKRKVVEFKPPIKFSLLDTKDEDDSEQSKRPQSSTESLKATGQRVGGLIALLPPPKKSLGAGVGLGGGGVLGGNRRPALEGYSDPVNLGQNATSSAGNIGPRAEPRNSDKAELNVAGSGPSTYDYGFESTILSDVSYGQYDSNHRYPGDNGCLGGIGGGSHSVQGQANVPDALAEVMKKERRKGRDGIPLEVIEVKQADLTGGSKLKQGQQNGTGMVFGPSYQPVSSNKDKPSKLHRRKHQIGALFFDMKQNEMNLMERRSKGSLTRAETQAKYGW